MADIDQSLRLWSATASSNKPTGATSIGAGLDDNLRAICATVRQYLASPGSTIASSATVDLSTADGRTIPISGSSTVTGLGTESAGIEYLLTTVSTPVFKHSSALSLPGAADITAAAGDYLLVQSKGSGNWVVPWYSKAAIGTSPPFTDSSPLVKNSSVSSATIRFSASALSAARVVSWPDANLSIPAITNKGDWPLGSSTGVMSALTAGANDTFPIADSSATPGVKWGTVNSFTEDTSPDQASDYVLTYDASATTSKKVVLGRTHSVTNGSVVASTSGTSIDFTGIPSWATKIHIMFNGVSTTGTSDIMVQIGPSGGVETSGYVSGVLRISAATSFTTGFGVTSSNAAASLTNGMMTIVYFGSSTWAEQMGAFLTSNSLAGGGTKTITGTLDRVRITTVGGTDTFDAGTINIAYT